MRCDGCAWWNQVTKTVYDDGSEVENFRSPDGKGHCGALEIDTDPDFGCNKYVPGENRVHITARKSGSPWNHSKAGPCPDCSGKGNAGDGSCDRCQGTGKVRHYDDGFIGEERTRLHPKEREMAAPPKCVGCGREMNREWVACPACGHRREMPAVPEIVALKLDAS